MHNSFPASADFCHLLITVCKQFGPISDQNVGPDLGSNCLTPVLFLTGVLNP